MRCRLLSGDRELQQPDLAGHERQVGLVANGVVGKLPELDIELDGVAVDRRLRRNSVLQVDRGSAVANATEMGRDSAIEGKRTTVATRSVHRAGKCRRE